jgi:hypothetical protein
MPGSSTRQGRTCAPLARTPVLPSAHDNGVGVPIDSFAAQWLAYMHPCRRFAPGLAADGARLGASAVRYAFTVVDLHHILLACLPAHCHLIPPAPPCDEAHSQRVFAMSTNVFTCFEN